MLSILVGRHDFRNFAFHCQLRIVHSCETALRGFLRQPCLFQLLSVQLRQAVV